MDPDNQPPVVGKAEDGRYKVDLHNIRSPWVKLAIALGTIGAIVGLAVRFPTGPEVADETVVSLIPYVGGAVVVLVLVAIVLTRFGGGKN